MCLDPGNPSDVLSSMADTVRDSLLGNFRGLTSSHFGVKSQRKFYSGRLKLVVCIALSCFVV